MTKGYLEIETSPNTLLVSYIVLGLCLFNDNRKAYISLIIKYKSITYSPQPSQL